MRFSDDESRNSRPQLVAYSKTEYAVKVEGYHKVVNESGDTTYANVYHQVVIPVELRKDEQGPWIGVCYRQEATLSQWEPIEKFTYGELLEILQYNESNP